MKRVLLGILIGILFFWAAGATYLVHSNPFPWPDRGSDVFICPSKEARTFVLERAIERGLAPQYRIDTQAVSRALMDDRTTLFDVVSDPETVKKVGSPVAIKMFVSEDPRADAEKAVKAILWNAEMTGVSCAAEAVHDPDPGLPQGGMSVVKTDYFGGGWTIGYRWHAAKLGGGGFPPRWEWDE